MANEKLLDMILYNIRLSARVVCLWLVYRLNKLYERLN